MRTKRLRESDPDTHLGSKQSTNDLCLSRQRFSEQRIIERMMCIYRITSYTTLFS